MLPKALIVNCWQVLYTDRAGAERIQRTGALFTSLLQEGGIAAPPAVAQALAAHLLQDPAPAARGHAVPPLVQRILDVCRDGNLPIPAQAAARLARKINQDAVNFTPPSQQPEAFKMLKKLAAHYALVLCANTTLPAAAGLREVLDGDHLLQFFRATLFSEELGVGLPDPQPYRAALDLLRYEPRDVGVVAGNLAQELPAARALRLPVFFIRREAAPPLPPPRASTPAPEETFPDLAALVTRLQAD